MSPRRNRRQPDWAAPGGAGARRVVETVEVAADGQWRVRALAGSAEDKLYRCPGCDQTISARQPHVVAWPADGDPADRRHWHTACWRARGRRRPHIRRSRSAPRY